MFVFLFFFFFGLCVWFICSFVYVCSFVCLTLVRCYSHKCCFVKSEGLCIIIRMRSNLELKAILLHRLNINIVVKDNSEKKMKLVPMTKMHTFLVDFVVSLLVIMTVLKEMTLFIQKLPLLRESGCSYSIVISPWLCMQASTEIPCISIVDYHLER